VPHTVWEPEVIQQISGSGISDRLPRATRVQAASRGRIPQHQLPDGPEQRARDAAFTGEDPLSHNDWIYAHDAEHAAVAATPAG